jgi:hypothetical protein
VEAAEVTPADDHPERVEAILTSPLGVLVAVTAAERVSREPTLRLRSGMLEEWVVEGCADLNPHRPEHGEIVGELTSAAPDLRATAEWLLGIAATSAWFEPLDRASQVWASPDGSPPDPAAFRASTWQRRGLGSPSQLGGPWTATAGEEAEEPAWLRVRARRGANNGTPLPSPALWNLVVADDARVFEVDGPLAWRWLCRRYPAQVARGEVLPDWTAVANDWAGVHVSVGGLVTAHGVAVGSASSWSTVRGWDAEGTLWLRWAFSQALDLTSLHDLPEHAG